jgi:hypothetical protein
VLRAYIDGMTNTTSTAKDTSVRYELTLTVVRPVRYDHDAPMSEQEEWAVSRDAKRELEREVLRAMKRLDGDCDCEVMSAAIVAE